MKGYMCGLVMSVGVLLGSQAWTAETMDEKVGICGLSNPFIACEDWVAAEGVAGFAFHVPEGTQWPVSVVACRFTAIRGQLIEGVYELGDVKGARICLRKGRGKAGEPRDISGVYTVYPVVKSVTIGAVPKVMFRGDEEHIFVATWSVKGADFAIVCEGMGLTETQMRCLVERMY